MKLALVTETYPPEINGVAMTLSQLVEGLREKGHTVQVVRPRQRGESSSPDGHGQGLLARGAPIPRYPELRFGLPCRRRLLRAWRANPPHLVHVATEGPLGLSAIQAAKRLGIPTTSTFHTNFHSYSQHYNARFLASAVLALLRWVHNKTEATMAPTQELADELTEAGFRNMEVFGRGVRLDVFRPAARDDALRRSWGASGEAPLLVHVSRLAAEKNYELLFRAYQRIRDNDPSARFVVVGDGPLLQSLRRRYPFAHFTGAIPLEQREDLARIYASADLFVYPSMTETYGNVVPEAMASGLAVVAFDYAAAGQHIRTGRNGIAVPMGDEEAFLEASLQLARDRPRRQRLGREASSYARAFDWQPVIDRFESILLRVARGEPKQR